MYLGRAVSLTSTELAPMQVHSGIGDQRVALHLEGGQLALENLVERRRDTKQMDGKAMGRLFLGFTKK